MAVPPLTDLENALLEAQKVYDEALARRNDAIREALRGGASQRKIAGLTNCSREEVRKIAQSRAITYVLEGTEYELSEDETRVLAYKAVGFGAGAFSGDVQRLGAGDAWLGAARELGHDLARTQQGLVVEPVALTPDTAYALFQILRLTYTARPSRLADLWDALAAERTTRERRGT